MKNQLMGCLRRGGAAEAGLAVRALGLHLLSLGLGPELDRLVHSTPPSPLQVQHSLQYAGVRACPMCPSLLSRVGQHARPRAGRAWDGTCCCTCL